MKDNCLLKGSASKKAVTPANPPEADKSRGPVRFFVAAGSTKIPLPLWEGLGEGESTTA
jgi:hypothetical protein